MFLFFLRVGLIVLVLYLVYVLLMGGYNWILSAYWWMRP